MSTLNELQLAKELDSAGTPSAMVTMFPSGLVVTPEGHQPLAAFIRAIRTGVWQQQIAHIRALAARGEKAMVQDLKRKLPAATLSCTMWSRSRGAEKRTRTHSGWLQLDFDPKENPSLDQAAARAALQADPHVGAVFVGPSGLGIKGVVRIDPTRHLDSARSAQRYFAETHNLVMDNACSDVERLCFASFDPDAWLRDGVAAVLPITDPAAPRPMNKEDAEAHQMPLGILSAVHLTEPDVREMLGFIPKRPDYMRWLRIASAVFSVLPFEQGAAVLNEWSPEEAPGEYHSKWQNRLKDVGIGTLVRYAQEHGFDAAAAARRRRWVGQVYQGGKLISGGTSGTSGTSKPPPPAPHANLLEPEKDNEGIPMEEIWGALEAEQYGDAVMFWRQESQNYAYDPGENTWRHWSPATGRWHVVDVGAVRLQVMWTATATYRALIDRNLESMATTPAAKGDPRKEENERLLARIANLRKTAYLNSVLTMVASHPRLVRPANRFDSSPHLLGLEDGMVFDFRTCIVRPSTREDFLTITAPVAFDESATCPKFDAFLLRAMGGDQEMVDFLWRAVGMSMTGMIDTAAFFFCYGDGANGKSTWMTALACLLGEEYFSPLDTSTLMAGPIAGQAAQYAKAELMGKRIIAAEETSRGGTLNDGIIKSICSQDRITARRPAGRPFSFLPSHTLWITGNSKPSVTDTSEGMWRRMHLIPWRHQIPEAERLSDTVVKEQILAELPGILNRALGGWADYLDRGRRLAAPHAVRNAVAEYRADEDSLGRFMEERTAACPDAMIELSELFREYMTWCEAGGGRPGARTHRELGARLRSARFGIEVGPATKSKRAHVLGVCWRGE
jgi:P4 family phage/plasmid primase-like protien